MRNGTGGYQLPANSWNPAVNGSAATAADWNSTAQDIEAAIQQSVSSDGQTPMVGNLNMNGNKVTGLANPSADGDAVSLGRLNDDDGSSLIGYLPSGTGAVPTNVQVKLRQFVNVKDFGAVGDGVADDTAAVQACADYLATLADSVVVNSLAAKNHPTLYFPSADGYRITAPITVGKNISVVCDGPILVDASASAVPSASAWVVIGEDETAGNRSGRTCEFVLDVRRLTLSNWSNPADVGVKLLTAGARLWLRRFDNFAIGVKTTAPYSVTTLGEFRDCQIGLDVTATTQDFTNQQLFLGGEFAVVNGSNNGLDRYGVRLTRAGFIANQNSLVFAGPSFELNATAAGAAECLPFLVSNFQNVRVENMRMEGSGTTVAKLTNDTRWFQADLIYNAEFDYPSAGLLIDQSTYKIGNRAYHSGGDFDPFKSNLVFEKLCSD